MSDQWFLFFWSSLPNARPHSLAMCLPVPHSECCTDGPSTGEGPCIYLACRSATEGSTGNLTGLMALGARVWLTQILMLCFIYLELNCAKKNCSYIYVFPTHQILCQVRVFLQQKPHLSVAPTPAQR